LELDCGRNLLQKTVLRVSERNVFATPVIICGESQRWQIEDSLRKVNITNYELIIEPYSKNTAPAIAAATLLFKYKNAPMLFLPVDHIIANEECFIEEIIASLEVAKKFIITFGIKNVTPLTAYGYMERGDKIGNSVLYRVAHFIEKPKYEVAKLLVAKNYLWNSGIFLLHPDVFLKELKEICPQLIEHVIKAVNLAEIKGNVFSLEPNHYNECEDISVDCCVLEKTKFAATLPSNLNWSDIGNLSSFSQRQGSQNFNVIEGDGLLLESKNCHIHSKGVFTAAIGVEDLVIISTQDAILVSHKDKTEEVKEVVRHLEQTERQNLLNGNVEYRPWGHYENLTEGSGYKIKKITVNPKSKLSLQSHEHRAEQWTVLKGIARVTVNDRVFDLTEGKSTYIPIKAQHRLENLQNHPLKIIEIQLGQCLEESDIKRFDDIYGRE
jgi:mannose-1-phosphate guanylyltransferase/mannose-6-phosphate isomerase